MSKWEQDRKLTDDTGDATLLYFGNKYVIFSSINPHGDYMIGAGFDKDDVRKLVSLLNGWLDERK